MLEIRIASATWQVELVRGWIINDGAKLRGCCDYERQWIGVSDVLDVTKRVQVCWHELAHAIREELDISPNRPLDEEPWARLFSLGMVHVSRDDLD